MKLNRSLLLGLLFLLAAVEGSLLLRGLETAVTDFRRGVNELKSDLFSGTT